MNNVRLKSTLPIFALILLFGLVSCQVEEKPLQEEEAAYVAEDVVSDFALEDADDLTSLALLADAAPGGGRMADGPRNITINDPRCQCENLNVTIELASNSTPAHPVGTIVIDFGSGCTDLIGNVRKGKIIINFSGRRFMPGSSVVTTFNGYSFNDIGISGVRTLTTLNESTETSPKFKIELEDGQAEWPDGTVATREHCLVRQWIRAANPVNDQLVVTQCSGVTNAASGTNRRGRAYTMKIIQPLIYKRGCPVAVSGTKEFTDVTSGKVITVDYGDGSCDRTVTISVNGQTRSFEINRRG
ncbi:MAG: hypothetical protein N2044_00545 [Cyclobacteriaceae bacterium]|nr:hypothetical protein [Cyclobacteriaceae bacterium]